MSWWKPCRHNWVEIGRTKLPGINATEITGSGDRFSEMMEAMQDRTSILLRCQHCGSIDETVVLGWFPTIAHVERTTPESSSAPTEAKP